MIDFPDLRSIDGSDVAIEFKLSTSSPTWFPLGSLKFGSSLVSNSIATNRFFMGWEEFTRPKNSPGLPKVSLSWERKKESPSPEESGFTFWTEKEKCVEKDAVVFETGS